jgi:hypothetical protein
MSALFAGLLCLAVVGEAGAQAGGPNFPSYFVAFAVGAPGFILNGAGSNYGEAFNSSSTTWNLGYGTASATLPNGYPAFASNGTAVLSWNTSGQVNINPSSSLALNASNLFQVNSLADASGNAYYYLGYLSTGWLALHAASGVLPTISSCGTNPSAASGVDEAGDVTVGTSPSNTCIVRFSSPAPSIPHCTCNNSNSTNSGCQVTSVATNGFTMFAPKVLAIGAGTDALQANDRLDWTCLATQ